MVGDTRHVAAFALNVTSLTKKNLISKLRTLLTCFRTWLTSSRLLYRIKKEPLQLLISYGGRYKARTCDPLNVVQVRYQLRQSPLLNSLRPFFKNLRFWECATPLLERFTEPFCVGRVPIVLIKLSFAISLTDLKSILYRYWGFLLFPHQRISKNTKQYPETTQRK